MATHSCAMAPGLFAPDRSALPPDFSWTERRVKRHGIYLIGRTDPTWSRLALDSSVSLYRQKAWKELLEEAFGCEGETIAYLEGDHPAEVLPFFRVRDPLLRRRLVAAPYACAHGGFTCADPTVRRLLIEYVLDYAPRLDVQQIEIRSEERVPELERAGFGIVREAMRYVVPLVGESAAWERISPSHRRNISIAQRAGIRVASSIEWEDMAAFFDILEEECADPDFHLLDIRFFRLLWEKLISQRLATLLVARHGHEIIGGQLLLHDGPVLTCRFNATRRHHTYPWVYAAYALVWESLRLAAAQGHQAADLGPVAPGDTGLRVFRDRFGAEPRPLYYYVRNTHGTPERFRLGDARTLLHSIRQRMPRPLARLLGSCLGA